MKSNVSGVSESVSGMGEKIKDKVTGSDSTDDLSKRIDEFLNEKSDQLIKDWELATKNDISDLEKVYKCFNGLNKYKGQTNEKLEKN